MGNCIQKEIKSKRISNTPSSHKPISDSQITVDSPSLIKTNTKKQPRPTKRRQKKKNDSHGPSGEEDDDFPKNNNKNNKKKNNNPKGEFNKKKLEKLFDHYKEPSDLIDDDKQEYIGPDGLTKFCKDLSIDGTEDPVLFVLAYHCNAVDMEGFSKLEFVSGLEKLKLDTVEKIKGYLPVLRKELENQETLKLVYKWAFQFAKSESGHKTVDKEVAGVIWGMLLGRYFHVGKFVEYLKKDEQEGVKVINADQWINLYDFALTIKDDFSNYDENAAWPCILDDYVRWMQEGSAGAEKSNEDEF